MILRYVTAKRLCFKLLTSYSETSTGGFTSLIVLYAQFYMFCPMKAKIFFILVVKNTTKLKTYYKWQPIQFQWSFCYTSHFILQFKKSILRNKKIFTRCTGKTERKIKSLLYFIKNRAAIWRK